MLPLVEESCAEEGDVGDIAIEWLKERAKCVRMSGVWNLGLKSGTIAPLVRQASSSGQPWCTNGGGQWGVASHKYDYINLQRTVKDRRKGGIKCVRTLRVWNLEQESGTSASLVGQASSRGQPW